MLLWHCRAHGSHRTVYLMTTTENRIDIGFSKNLKTIKHIYNHT